MLRKTQIGLLVLLAAVLWLLVTLNIRFRPGLLLQPLDGMISFAIAPLAGWLSVWLCKLVGRLSTQQLLPGVALVGAVAMMIDGAALRWHPDVYGFDDRILRIGAAWLLWGYGVAFAVALLWAARSQSTTGLQSAGRLQSESRDFR